MSIGCLHVEGEDQHATGAATSSSAINGEKGVFGVMADASETCSASGLEAALSATLGPVRACSCLARRRIREGVGYLEIFPVVAMMTETFFIAAWAWMDGMEMCL